MPRNLVQDAARGVVRLTRVDDDWKSQLVGESELGGEERALGGGCLGRVVEVEAGLADGGAGVGGVLDEVPWHRSSLRGVIHCYTGAPAFARQLLDRGFMVSFSGIVTFRRAETVRASAKYVPDDRLLIETDSPYLAPIPLRGQTNEPAFVVHTARFLADLRQVPAERLAAQTFANAVSLFG